MSQDYQNTPRVWIFKKNISIFNENTSILSETLKLTNKYFSWRHNFCPNLASLFFLHHLALIYDPPDLHHTISPRPLFYRQPSAELQCSFIWLE